MTAHTVNLRKYKISKGRESHYLQYHPPVRDPETMKMMYKEVLGIYTFIEPKDDFEREHNEDMMLIVRKIYAKRLQSVLNEDNDIFSNHRLNENFLEYFAKYTNKKNEKWKFVFKHFFNFVDGKCTFKEITVDLCRRFGDYLLNDAEQLGHIKRKLSNNSAAGYFSTFRALLKIAYRDKRIKENVNDFIDKIEWKQTKREYLTFDEVEMLINTPCDIPVLKNAAMFSILTGLRISDIKQLNWGNIVLHPKEGWSLRMVTIKTETQASLPISDEALEWCGERDNGLVFKNLERSMTLTPLTKWLRRAGIKKHITFHSFRHTFATLQIASGTDIYTLSKMLTHKHVSTTEIYADLVSEKKIQSANRLSFKKK